MKNRCSLQVVDSALRKCSAKKGVVNERDMQRGPASQVHLPRGPVKPNCDPPRRRLSQGNTKGTHALSLNGSKPGKILESLLHSYENRKRRRGVGPRRGYGEGRPMCFSYLKRLCDCRGAARGRGEKVPHTAGCKKDAIIVKNSRRTPNPPFPSLGASYLDPCSTPTKLILRLPLCDFRCRTANSRSFSLVSVPLAT